MLSMVHSRDFELVALITYSRLKVIDPSTFKVNFRALSEFDMPENIAATCGWVRKKTFHIQNGQPFGALSCRSPASFTATWQHVLGHLPSLKTNSSPPNNGGFL